MSTIWGNLGRGLDRECGVFLRSAWATVLLFMNTALSACLPGGLVQGKGDSLWSVTLPFECRVASGVWIDQGRTLLLLTRRPYRLVGLFENGTVAVFHQFPIPEYPEFLPTGGISWGPEGTLWLTNNNCQLLLLDPTLHDATLLSVRRWTLKGSGPVVDVAEPHVVAQTLVAIVEASGTAAHDGGFFGVASIRLGAEESFTPLRQVDRSTDAGRIVRQLPTLAAAADRAFALLFDDKPHLEQVYPAQRRLRIFPPGCAALSDLGRGVLDDFWGFWRAFDKSPMAAGLVGWGQYLYVLTRQPLEAGEIRWLLYRMDPLADRIEGVVAIPSRAPYLLVIPGPRFWAIVERDLPLEPVDRNSRVVVVPAARVEQGAGPIAGWHRAASRGEP